MGYSPRDRKELDMTEPLSVYANMNTHTHTYTHTHTHTHEEITISFPASDNSSFILHH